MFESSRKEHKLATEQETMQLAWRDEDTGEEGTFFAHPKASVAEGLRANGIDPKRNINVWAVQDDESRKQSA